MQNTKKDFQRPVDKISVFEDKKIRRLFHQGEWYFSLVDIIIPRLKQVTICWLRLCHINSLSGANSSAIGPTHSNRFALIWLRLADASCHLFGARDNIEVLTGSSNPRRYWSDLKIQLIENEGFFQLYGKIVQLKILAPDGKKWETGDFTGKLSGSFSFSF